MNILNDKNKKDEINIINENSKKDEKIYIFSEKHTEMYLSAYKMFLDHKIFGVGIKNFRNFCKTEKYMKNSQSCSTHPHNIYIQLLSETGIYWIYFFIIYFFIFL